MTMADRIVIMKNGFVQQVGKPMELYEHPVNKFVAGFIGSPQMNFFDVTVDGCQIVFSDGNRMQIKKEMAEKLRKCGNKVILGIRGEDVKFDPQNLDVYKENNRNPKITVVLGGDGEIRTRGGFLPN